MQYSFEKDPSSQEISKIRLFSHAPIDFKLAIEQLAKAYNIEYDAKTPEALAKTMDSIQEAFTKELLKPERFADRLFKESQYSITQTSADADLMPINYIAWNRNVEDVKPFLSYPTEVVHGHAGDENYYSPTSGSLSYVNTDLKNDLGYSEEEFDKEDPYGFAGELNIYFSNGSVQLKEHEIKLGPSKTKPVPVKKPEDISEVKGIAIHHRIPSNEFEFKHQPDPSKTKAEEKDKVDEISRKLNMSKELQSLEKLENEYKINPKSVTQDSVVDLLERIKKINSKDNNQNPEYINVRDRIINLYADVCVKTHIDWDKADRRRNVVGGMVLGFFIGFVAGFLAGGIGALPGAIIGAIIGGGGGVGGGLAGYAATPFLNRMFGSSKQEHIVLRENLVESMKAEFINELSQNQTVGNSSTLSTAQGLTDQPGVLLERKENIKSSAATTPLSYAAPSQLKNNTPTRESKKIKQGP